MSLFEELKRRNVFRVAIAYVLLGWAVLQGADFLLDLAGAPEWVIRALAVIGLVGFPFALFFAWAFELTPEGVKRERDVDRGESITPQTRRKLDRLIILFLVVAVGFLLVDRYFGPDRRPADVAGEAIAAPAPAAAGGDADRRSVAVLPFVAMSSGLDDGYFADGLTEEILNALAQLPELLVTARTSAFQFKGQDVAVQDIAQRLGVDHIVEGSVRRAGDRLRVTAQLIRAADGFHLWSNNYDAGSEDAIAVQEDIAEQIALALDVVLDESRRAAMQRAGLRDPEAFIAFQRAQELNMRAHQSSGSIGRDLALAVPYLDQVLERVAGYPPALKIRADQAVHLLWEDANALESARLTAADREATEQQFRADLEEAMRNGRSEDERDNIAYDLAYLGGDWRGMRRRIESAIAQTGCDVPAWLDSLALAFGYAEFAVKRYQAATDCDPLGDYWDTLVRTQAVAGDTDAALASARRARETLGLDRAHFEVVFAHLRQGDFERAEQAAQAQVDQSPKSVGSQVMVAAMQGNAEAAAGWLEEFRQLKNSTGHRLLAMVAWLGDREAANRLAAEFDARPMGHLTLATATQFCACGAPWDLEVTPVFAGKLREAGLEWPPVEPLKFPLKDW
jgi:TolB-like protein